jgi:chemotaxis protein CheX
MSVTNTKSQTFIQDFIDATVDVLTTMAFFEVETRNVKEMVTGSGAPSVTSCRDITGVLGFSGSRAGSILLTLSEKLGLQLVGGMLGTELSQIDYVVRDGVGELVNMIAGGAKTRLQTKGLDFVLSIPHTVVGQNHQITAPASARRTRIEFISGTDTFFVEICMKEGNQ